MRMSQHKQVRVGGYTLLGGIGLAFVGRVIMMSVPTHYNAFMGATIPDPSSAMYPLGQLMLLAAVIPAFIGLVLWVTALARS